MGLDVMVLSPSYEAATDLKTIQRNARMIKFLGEDGSFPDGGAPELIRLMREDGYPDWEKLTESMALECRRMYRIVWQFYNNPQERERIDHRLATIAAQGGRGRRSYREYFGIFCFKQDNPSITTWEEIVERMHEATGSTPASDQPRSLAADLGSLRALADLYPVPQAPDIQSIIVGMDSIQADFRAYAHAVHGKIADMQARLDHQDLVIRFLRSRLGEYAASQSTASNAVADISKRTAELQRVFSIADSGLPLMTSVSGMSNGWRDAFEIIYGEVFCERFFDDYLVQHERSQVIKAIRFFAREGPYYPGLETKRMDKRLPGIPPAIRHYQYSRAADDLRFTWKHVGKTVHIYCVYTKNEIAA